MDGGKRGLKSPKRGRWSSSPDGYDNPQRLPERDWRDWQIANVGLSRDKRFENFNGQFLNESIASSGLVKCEQQQRPSDGWVEYGEYGARLMPTEPWSYPYYSQGMSQQHPPGRSSVGGEFRLPQLSDQHGARRPSYQLHQRGRQSAFDAGYYHDSCYSDNMYMSAVSQAPRNVYHSSRWITEVNSSLTPPLPRSSPSVDQQRGNDPRTSITNQAHHGWSTNAPVNDCWAWCGSKLARHLEMFNQLTYADVDIHGRGSYKRQNNYLLKVLFSDSGECLYHVECIVNTFNISKGRFKRLQDRIKREMRGETTRHGLFGRPSNNRKKLFHSAEEKASSTRRDHQPSTDAQKLDKQRLHQVNSNDTSQVHTGSRDMQDVQNEIAAMQKEHDRIDFYEGGSSRDLSSAWGSIVSSARTSRPNDSGFGSVISDASKEYRYKPHVPYPQRKKQQSDSDNMASPELD